MVIGSNHYILCFQQCSVFRPAQYQTACMIDNPVAGIIPIKFRLTQYLSHQTGIFLPSDQLCDLTVRCYLTERNFRYNREYLIYQPVIQNLIHNDSFKRTDCHTSVRTGSQ